ncbi:MAG: hypothetical protein Q7K43_06030, partial [Candidatus Woesearchaeota archaeon]|nr:hypothetical protein [Candidatus Woesearchaeota archaeon]
KGVKFEAPRKTTSSNEQLELTTPKAPLSGGHTKGQIIIKNLPADDPLVVEHMSSVNKLLGMNLKETTGFVLQETVIDLETGKMLIKATAQKTTLTTPDGAVIQTEAVSIDVTAEKDSTGKYHVIKTTTTGHSPQANLFSEDTKLFGEHGLQMNNIDFTATTEFENNKPTQSVVSLKDSATGIAIGKITYRQTKQTTKGLSQASETVEGSSVTIENFNYHRGGIDQITGVETKSFTQLYNADGTPAGTEGSITLEGNAKQLLAPENQPLTEGNRANYKLTLTTEKESNRKELNAEGNVWFTNSKGEKVIEFKNVKGTLTQMGDGKAGLFAGSKLDITDSEMTAVNDLDLSQYIKNLPVKVKKGTVQLNHLALQFNNEGLVDDSKTEVTANFANADITVKDTSVGAINSPSFTGTVTYEQEKLIVAGTVKGTTETAESLTTTNNAENTGPIQIKSEAKIEFTQDTHTTRTGTHTLDIKTVDGKPVQVNIPTPTELKKQGFAFAGNRIEAKINNYHESTTVDATVDAKTGAVTTEQIINAEVETPFTYKDPNTKVTLEGKLSAQNPAHIEINSETGKTTLNAPVIKDATITSSSGKPLFKGDLSIIAQSNGQSQPITPTTANEVSAALAKQLGENHIQQKPGSAPVHLVIQANGEVRIEGEYNIVTEDEKIISTHKITQTFTPTQEPAQKQAPTEKENTAEQEKESEEQAVVVPEGFELKTVEITVTATVEVAEQSAEKAKPTSSDVKPTGYTSQGTAIINQD